ncbi:hypothetical protein [Burkholderia seminalis]|uniref:hypothetical protein n=1 Tax=Burkholderia seminalis TaxID=488731 RepID=UPI0014545B39|nr:hypothetical protein [Burkholderia seminalis]MCA8430024.1 hypothetical protein [Burkholderia seminalis]VWB15744.1 outer membrane autotransporter [Burkholderia seminalis]
MKRIFATIGSAICAIVLLWTLPAHSQFISGQLLTAGQLNYAFSNVLPLTGGTLTGALTVPTLASSNATITGGSITGLSSPIPVASGGTGTTTRTGTGSVVLSTGASVGSLTVSSGTFASPAFASFGNQSAWLNSLIPCTTACAQTWSQSTGGGMGLLGATRSSDNTLAGSMAAQGVAGYAINDNTSQVQTVYAGYFEARRAAGAGTTQGNEIDIVNQGSVVGLDPYNMFSTGTTPGMWISSGRPDVTTSAANASAAIGVINNNTAFENGLVFHSTALNTTSGEGNAIVLPQKDAVVWYGSAGNKVAAIRSDATTASLRMIFANGQMVLQDLSGNTKFTFTTTGGFTTPSSIQGSTVYGTNGVVLPVTTVASLPGCGAGTRGYLYAVTDAASPTYNSSVTGGGSTTIPVFCNGTSWTAH